MLNLLLPPQCLTCDAPVADQGGLCVTCFSATNFLNGPACVCCAVPFSHPGEGGAGRICPHCAEAPPPWRHARAALRYDEAGRRLILPLKHADRTELAGSLAAMMARAGAGLLEAADVLVPVPLHPSRLRARGYNQSALLARAIAWSQEAKAAANEIFNITNGDMFTFPDVFLTAARCFDMDIGLAQAAPLAVLMSDKEALWAQIVRKCGLRPYTLEQLVGASWEFADAAFSSPDPFFESTIKIRQAGFVDCIDSVVMFDEWFRELKSRRILPL